MTEQTIDAIPTMNATDRFIQLAKRGDGEAWEVAYALREAVDEHLPKAGQAAARAGNDGTNTGLHGAISEVWSEARDAGLVEINSADLAMDYRTAVAWPKTTRIKGATYAAHKAVRAMPDRRRKLAQWVKESSDGHIGRDEARLKKQGLTPTPKPISPPQRFENAVRAALRKWATGAKLTANEQREAKQILQVVIDDIDQGEF